MEEFDRKQHWDKIYQTNEPSKLSWYQPSPFTSMNFIKQAKIPVTAKIIDIGGGDGFFVDHLLDLGYQDITILDISEVALKRVKQRLGNRAAKVKWIVSDVTAFRPMEKFDFWHDRAAFHFLTKENEIANYLETLQQAICPEGFLVIGTFSDHGPEMCSGIKIKQYSESTMTSMLNRYFEKIECVTVDHYTPLGKIQNFIFCSFSRL